MLTLTCHVLNPTLFCMQQQPLNLGIETWDNYQTYQASYELLQFLQNLLLKAPIVSCSVTVFVLLY